ncbi:hypothetical protein LOZ61_004764 [Ophidiomyces ophidiicola]|uniref:Uncharacterized protein n=1 Tax=Ophidiomyces ophidiicola TaxID=1387563 RepID=A0ACB8UVP3_9EURO|nr:uncharacterized protein LOZ57_001317 [Ophidiomyces ophidiicola]KAI1907637.1 hypothetical protein LOZ64_005809 [Ophidiomyces ophidiicola]KAI1909838.1 hypothetical protein LOZ61_004764 [Ophidiomyces ophidiicola]KAI1925008.1 hypothetical protein LOZ60_004370 [Ophidiomyces ophidiicola]KAI1950757.1 hypothetical protein LOZ59_005729 [Ophidiomyces ophidiicola]KAI1951904.1 hypothetical protein LOZ57_001317 [Ophidiomyces ophidiicola]
MLTDSEKTACVALSRLFLNTQFLTDDYNDIAAALRPLDMSLESLDHVLRHDLFPILYPNLLEVAGEWTGFDEDWLLKEVECRRRFRDSWVKPVGDSGAWQWVGNAVTTPWNEVKQRLKSRLWFVSKLSSSWPFISQAPTERIPAPNAA